MSRQYTTAFLNHRSNMRRPSRPRPSSVRHGSRSIRNRAGAAPHATGGASMGHTLVERRPRYGGGTPPPENAEGGWHLVGPAAEVLAPEPIHHGSKRRTS